jgi:hypothetical protein
MDLINTTGRLQTCAGVRLVCSTLTTRLIHFLKDDEAEVSQRAPATAIRIQTRESGSHTEISDRSNTDSFVSFPNDILASFIAHPYLMHLPCWYIYSGAHSERFLRRILIPRVSDGETASTYQMSCQAAMRVWRIVRIATMTVSVPVLVSLRILTSHPST